MVDDALNKYKMMYRAKNCLDDLRQGLDPVSRRPVPGDSVIRQEEVLTCFSFLSELLNELLLETPTPAPSASPNLPKAPFVLAPEQVRKVKMSYYPIAVSTFVNHINSVLDKTATKSIRGKDITGWLCEKGLLEERKVQVTKEETDYLPSRYADGLGLLAIKKDSEPGQAERYALKLGRQAQQFILDNIDDLAEYAGRSK